MRRSFIFILIAAILLTMQGFPVLAETAEPEQPESQIGMSETEQPENPAEVPEGQAETTDEESEEETEAAEQEENEPETKSNPVTAAVPDDIIARCIVPGQNPPGVIVNLFDYWQDNLIEGGKEVAHDYYYWPDGDESKKIPITTYSLGISKGHLLRFGYTDTDECCNLFGQRGAWNMYRSQTPYPGIVKTRLGADGFPILNLSGKDYEQYNNYIDSYQTEESLAYLFSPYVSNGYKASYRNVQGLFQKREDDSYYYNSTQNFASYNSAANSFILYNSPGVAKVDSSGKAGFCGQFFPFNTAQDVFNNYTDEGNGNYRLDYQYLYVKQDENETDYSDYNSISDGKNGYMQCYAPDLNHYLGMTMEMQFLQPEGGCLPNDANTPMTFKFSGDDDVWIFIDDVLVADLGGLHDACSLKIDFSTGVVDVQGAGHTLLYSFQSVYGNDANPGGIAFRDNTFADNTVHTLKMFYLERGHMASNLSLDFNIQTLPIEPNEKDEPDEDPEPYSEEENTDENVPLTTKSILPADNEMPDNIGIPKTGDDSLIGWWAALSIISFFGICATVCNLILTRKKQKK